MSDRQNWFILGWMAVLSVIGAAALCTEPTEAAGWVFASPLILLALWAIARWAERNF